MQIKQFFRAAVVTVVVLCATPAMAADESCGPDKYIPNGTTNCIPCPTSGTIPDVCTWPFRVTTTADTTQVNFNISASGTFLVDCGGGTLSGPGVSGNTITKAYTTNSSYTCTYANAGARTIKFGGRATGYNNDGTAAAIEFYIQSNNVSRTKVAGISGSLGAIFPTIGTGNNVTQPRFNGTFSGCTNMIGSIPATLFSGISGAPAENMFSDTFSGCSGLTGSIPAGLFSGISGAPATDMFMETFSGCSGLTGSIPAGLFGTFNGAPANGMFWGTFENCSNLESYVVGGTLPDAPVQNPNWPPYYNTFTGATRMSPTCPANMYDRKPIGETWSITPGRPAVCWPCPPGTHSPAGSTSASACIEEGICEPGYYLPAGTEECVICPQGFWCYGGQFMYDESNDQGINPCPRHSTTAGPGAAFRGQCGTQFCPQTCPAGQITSNCSCVSMDDWARGRLHVKYDGRTYVVHNESDR